MEMTGETSLQAGPAQQWATRILFFIAGCSISAWAPLVPFVKRQLGLGEDALGMLLLCIGLGSVFAMPLAGAAASRFGCRMVLSAAVISALPLLAAIGAIRDGRLMALVLFFFGGAIGTMDVVSNVHALVVEKAAGRRLMSGFHGGWSVGGFAGAGLFGLIMNAFGTSPFVTIASIALMLLLLFLLISPHILSCRGAAAGASAFAWPKGIAFWIGSLCFLLFLAEGSIQDWGAVFLVDSRGMDISSAGIAYMIFSLAMLSGRISGDRIVQCLGARRTVVGGGVVGALGFFLVVFAPGGFSLAGFAVIGIGAANSVPVLYSLLGQQTAMPMSLAISAVTTMGYIGILLGPALIGFLAQATSIALSFCMLGLLLLVQAAVAWRLYKRI